MDIALLVILVLAATAGCAWFYWQAQQTEARIKKQEAEIREQALLIGELADQISMASQYLYEAMDQNLLEIERRTYSQATSVSVFEDQADQPAAHGTGSTTDAESAAPPADEAYGQFTSQEELATLSAAGASAEPNESEHSYHPHFQALALSAQGVESLEIARRTGLGVEELRLLMSFQEELSMGD